MRKYLLLFAIFFSLFLLFQTVNAELTTDPSKATTEALKYFCDSRPNSVLSGCSECARTCDYTKGLTSPCKASDCRAGTVFVDCYPANILFFTVGYRLNCINLQCGDAGVPSGNTCVQQSSLDSSCVNVAPKTYSWVDNTKPLSCDCVFTNAATITQYNKKDDGTDCTKDGVSGKCNTLGKCEPKRTGCTDPSDYKIKADCSKCDYFWCESPGSPANACVKGSADCKM